MAEFLTWFFSTIWPWVFVVLHGGVVVLASSHVVLTKRDSRSAIGWVGIIWLTPIIGTALTHIPTIGAQLNAVALNLQMAMAGALATAIAIRLYHLTMDGVTGIAGGAGGTPATAAR